MTPVAENLGAAGSGTAAQNAAVKAILDSNGFQSVGAARFFINGLDTTTRGIDVVAVVEAELHAVRPERADAVDEPERQIEGEDAQGGHGDRLGIVRREVDVDDPHDALLQAQAGQ